jgi:hypothetical protein
MLVPVLLLLAGQVKPAPIVPAGCSTYLHQAVLEVEQKLESGDFASAERLAPLLPSKKVGIWWDDSKVPANQRADFIEGRDKGLAQLKDYLKDLSFEVGAKQPQIRVSFVDSIPPREPGGVAPAAAHMVSSSVGEPRVEVVISLKRGTPAIPTQAVDVQSEVLYALATYFGLADSRLPMTMAFRTDTSWSLASRATPRDAKMIQSILRVADELRLLVAKKERVEPARPELLIHPLKLELDKATQGSMVAFSLQATNQGNAPLQIIVQPDCGCMIATPFIQLPAGDTILIKGQLDTTEFVGDLKKGLILHTNDGDFPTREVPVTLHVEPRYRLVRPGPMAVLMPDGGATVDVYLFTPEGKGFDITEVRLDGVPGDVEYKPWSGMLADPELNEPERNRQGYKFTVRMQDALPPGRSTATLSIATKDQRFPVLRHNITAQKGIVALPEQVWFGEVGRGPRRSVFLLSKPEVDFAIKKIESDNPTIKASHVAVSGQWEHKIIVEYDGQADFGNLEAKLTIHTSDPKQPKITVPVRAVVR